MTVTAKLQAFVPRAFEAVHVTVCVPMANGSRRARLPA